MMNVVIKSHTVDKKDSMFWKLAINNNKNNSHSHTQNSNPKDKAK